MNRESVLLALAGATLGALALSAAMFARLHPPEPEESTAALAAAWETLPAAVPAETFADGEAVPVLAELEADEEDPNAGPFYVSLRVPDPAPGEKLFVCDGLGCPLEEIVLDQDGDAALGPLAPGRYSIQSGQTELGSFRLHGNASLSEATGRAWTDGERLYLERYIPGTVRLTVTVRKTGYYAVWLCDREGRSWRRELYVSDRTQRDADGAWVQVLDFQGLAPGLYTATRRSQTLGQVELPAGETALLEVVIDK